MGKSRNFNRHCGRQKWDQAQRITPNGGFSRLEDESF
jgi:hypothetical protein